MERTECGVKKNGGLREGEGNSLGVQSHRASDYHHQRHTLSRVLPPRLFPCSLSHLDFLLDTPFYPYFHLYKLLHMSLLAQYANFLPLHIQLAVTATS